MTARLGAICIAFLLAACTAATVERDAAFIVTEAGHIEAACANALPLANAAILIPTAGPFIAAGVRAGCASAAGIERLARDPNSVGWLAQQSEMLRVALARRT